MAATEVQLPLTITIAALPVGFRGTPQQIADAIAQRIQISAQQTLALISAGATQPTSNIGPWAKNGNNWQYFDEDRGEYVPFIILDSQLKRQISIGQPTDDSIQIWYQIDDDGQPVGIKLRTETGGAITWVPLFYLKTEVYTQAQTNLAILQSNRYATRAKPNATQDFAIDNANHKLTFNGKIFDKNSIFDDSNARYTAPVKGDYQINALVRYNNAGGTASAMQAGLRCMKNGMAGVEVARAYNNTPSPAGSYWEVRIADTVQLDAGDFIELAGIAEDGVNSGDLQLQAESHWEVFLVQTEA